MSSKQQAPTTSERIADAITAFSGTMTFLLLNAALFAAWIVANTLLPLALHFDPFPFQFLTMAVSLEAIFLAIFVLISQNRQAASDRRLAQQDYVNNLQSKHELDAVLARIEQLADHLAEQDALILQAVSKPPRRSKAATRESHLHIVDPTTEPGGEARDE